MRVNAYLAGQYAKLYIPLSGFARKLRNISRKIRGKTNKFSQKTSLPTVKWQRCIRNGLIRLVETKKENGNVRISELGILSLLAKRCAEGSCIFEIGTFDGRTTLNLALNSPDSCKIFTLDLPQDEETVFNVDVGEKHFIDKPESGMRYKQCNAGLSNYTKKITQLMGDSAKFNFTPFEGKCSLVFVDGSHAYEYAIKDSDSAFRIIIKGGVIIWHDYGVWQGVTDALEELEEKNNLGLKHIYGTSLVYWQAPLLAF